MMLTVQSKHSMALKLMEENKNVLVSAHGNSLRSIVMFIEHLSEEEVLKLEIPTGSPLLFEFSEGKLVRQDF